MSFLDSYGYDPIEVLRSALGGGNAPMLAKTQQMEAQDIENQFRPRVPEYPVDRQAPGYFGHRPVRLASADSSFVPEIGSGRPPQGPEGFGFTPTPDDARMSQSYMELGYPDTGVREYKGFRPVIPGGPGDSSLPYPGETTPDPARMSPVQLAMAGGDTAGLTTGVRGAPGAPAPAPSPAQAPGATVTPDGSTAQVVPLPRARPAAFPERNLSVPVGPGSSASMGQQPDPGGLLGGLFSKDTIRNIARGLAEIKGTGKFASFARGMGGAYSGAEDRSVTQAEKSRKAALEEREQKRKEGDSASLRSYRASRAAGEPTGAGGEESTLNPALFGKGKRGVLDTMLRVEEAWQKMNDRHDKKRGEESRMLDSGSITQQKIDENEAKRQAEALRFKNTYGAILQNPPAGLRPPTPAGPTAAPKTAPIAIQAMPKDLSTLKDGAHYQFGPRVGKWDAKSKKFLPVE